MHHGTDMVGSPLNSPLPRGGRTSDESSGLCRAVLTAYGSSVAYESERGHHSRLANGGDGSLRPRTLFEYSITCYHNTIHYWTDTHYVHTHGMPMLMHHSFTGHHFITPPPPPP